MLTINELELLLKLSNGARMPHLEEEIFAQRSLLILYLRYLSMNRLGYNTLDQLNTILGDLCWTTELMQWAIYFYSVDIIRDRWLIAEDIMFSKIKYKWDNYYDKYRTRFNIA